MDGVQKSSQRMQILEYIRVFGSITSFEGVNALHIVDVRKRISELRARGWNIQDRVEKVTYQDGRTVRFKVYWLGEPECYE